MPEQLSPERSARLLLAKSAELEAAVQIYLSPLRRVGASLQTTRDIDKLYEVAGNLMADIALVAQLLAEHIERTEPWSHDIDDANLREYNESTLGGEVTRYE